MPAGAGTMAAARGTAAARTAANVSVLAAAAPLVREPRPPGIVYRF